MSQSRKSSLNNSVNSFVPQLIKYKIVLLGNQAVGKSSIINRFIYDMFDNNEHHHPTIGIDFISYNLVFNQKILRLQIWDTAGQERFRSLIPNYIRDTAVAIIVYDITDRKSFQSIQKWIDDTRYQRGDTVIIAVIGNKIDLDNRIVSEEEGRVIAQKNWVMFQQVSAKSGEGIKEIFNKIVTLLPDPDSKLLGIKQQQYNIMIKDNNNMKKSPPLKLNIDVKKKEKKCCNKH